MTSLFYKILYYGLLFIVTYLLFVYPSEVIELLILNGEIFNLKSLLTTLFINLLILIYFKTFNTNMFVLNVLKYIKISKFIKRVVNSDFKLKISPFNINNSITSDGYTNSK